MPKNSSAARREAARVLAAAEGISCTAALRRLDALVWDCSSTSLLLPSRPEQRARSVPSAADRPVTSLRFSGPAYPRIALAGNGARGVLYRQR